MFKRFVFFLCFVFFSFCADAQKDFEYIDTSLAPAEKVTEETTEPEEASFTTDTSVSIRPVIFPKDTVDSWKKRNGYSYLKNLDSLLRDKQKKEQQLDPASIKTGPNFIETMLQSGIVQIILWMIAIGVVIYILFQLFLSKGAFSRNSKKKAVQETLSEDEIFLEQNFDELIHQSYKLGNYRAATRYLFLKTLKQLSDKDLIAFGIDKTNSRYVAEVPAAFRDAFSRLILSYEYIWYGNIPLERDQFSTIETKFSAFLKTI